MRRPLTSDLQSKSPLTPEIVTSFCEFHQIINGERKKKKKNHDTVCDWIYQLRTKLRPSFWRIFHSQMIAGSFWVLIWESGKSYLDYQEPFGLTLGAQKEGKRTREKIQSEGSLYSHGHWSSLMKVRAHADMEGINPFTGPGP